MPIKIDLEGCIGCGICATLCPNDVIQIETGDEKPRIAFNIDCPSCRICVDACPVDAIETISMAASRGKIPFPFRQYLIGLGLIAEE